jgi:tryptophan-rich hypothetical protein
MSSRQLIIINDIKEREKPMNRINPKKLFRSKWTAVNPVKREKHFMVTEVEFDEGEVVRCMIEAVMTKREEDINWRELTDNQNWLPGWK